jgi:uncharacterized peroxidase-related enzyme
MPWIKTVSPASATGSVRKQYAAAVARSGKVYQVVQVMSVNPGAMHASMDLYLALMKGPSGLTRRQRELIATTVSALNSCVY